MTHCLVMHGRPLLFDVTFLVPNRTFLKNTLVLFSVFSGKQRLQGSRHLQMPTWENSYERELNVLFVLAGPFLVGAVRNQRICCPTAVAGPLPGSAASADQLGAARGSCSRRAAYAFVRNQTGPERWRDFRDCKK